MKLLTLVSILAFLGIAPLHAEDDHHHNNHAETAKEEGHDKHGEEGHQEGEGSSSSVGPDKAVTEADHDKGFKLSDAARKTLGIAEAAFSGQIPPSSVVRYQDQVGVYRVKDGWIKLVEPDELKTGDRIVTDGVPLLRVAELDAFSAGDAGHAH